MNTHAQKHTLTYLFTQTLTLTIHIHIMVTLSHTLICIHTQVIHSDTHYSPTHTPTHILYAHTALKYKLMLTHTQTHSIHLTPY